VSLGDKVSTPHIDSDMMVDSSPIVYLDNGPISSRIHKEMGELQKSQRRFSEVQEITKITNTGVLDVSSTNIINLYQKIPVH
jgi:hypothetical protein